MDSSKYFFDQIKVFIYLLDFSYSTQKNIYLSASQHVDLPLLILFISAHVSLVQLVRTMHNICKVQDSNSGHQKKSSSYLLLILCLSTQVRNFVIQHSRYFSCKVSLSIHSLCFKFFFI